MANKIRFHLDEHINHAIAKGLRQRGIDVTTTVEVGLRTLSDEAQMAYIRREDRVLEIGDRGIGDFSLLLFRAPAPPRPCPASLQTSSAKVRKSQAV